MLSLEGSKSLTRVIGNHFLRTQDDSPHFKLPTSILADTLVASVSRGSLTL